MKKYLNQDPSKFPIIIDIKSLSFSSFLVFCPFPSSVPDIKSLYTLNKYHNILPLYSGCPAKVNIFLLLLIVANIPSLESSIIAICLELSTFSTLYSF